MTKQLSLDALKSHLFETLEGVKNLSDSEASDFEKISIDQANAIVDISGKIIDICKIQVNAIREFAKLDNTATMQSLSSALGVVDETQIKQLH